MSAYLYVVEVDLPLPVRASARRRRDRATGDMLVTFEGCAFTGRLTGYGEIEFPFLHAPESRGWLENWLVYWGIAWRVLP